MVKRVLTALVIALGALGFFSIATAAANPQQDRQFFELLVQQGMEPGPTAVQSAYVVCSKVWSGVDPYAVAAIVRRDNPTLGSDLAERFVAAAIIVYCLPPELSSDTPPELSSGGTLYA